MNELNEQTKTKSQKSLYQFVGIEGDCRKSYLFEIGRRTLNMGVITQKVIISVYTITARVNKLQYFNLGY